MRKTDSELQQAVLKELEWDTRVAETDVGVEVDDGVVTLTGTVSSWAKRITAQEAAHRVIGVLDVANDVKVKAAGSRGRTDTEIAQAVRHALEWDDFVPDEAISSTVTDGWVKLDGKVDYWSEREDAERAVASLSGVRGVTNQIKLAPHATVENLQGSIESALERQAERAIKRIRLDVSDGKVSLSGVVHSWAERRAVVGAARGTPGVRSVSDHLRIEPYAA